MWKNIGMILAGFTVGLLTLSMAVLTFQQLAIEVPVVVPETVEPEPEKEEQEEVWVEVEEEPQEVPEVLLPVIDEPEPEPYEFNILGVGDNLIHNMIFIEAKARASSGYDFTFTYENMVPHIQNATIASVNQETVLARSFEASGYPRFNSPTEMAGALEQVGFDVISLSNNHMYDKGEQGLRETLELLTWDYDFTVVGAYLSEESFLDIPVREVEDVKVAFLGTTQHTNGLSIPSSSPLVGSVTAGEEDIPLFLEQVARAKEVADIVVANIHWGWEYTHTPSDFQVAFAQQAIEAGVDVIFGHHPHVIQPVEYITRSDGTQGVVCYSLGNFISCQDATPRMLGGMLDVTFLVEGDNISMKSVEFLPCITHYERNYRNVQVYPYDTYSPEMAAAHGISYFSTKMSYSYIFNHVTSVVDTMFLPSDFIELYGT